MLFSFSKTFHYIHIQSSTDSVHCNMANVQSRSVKDGINRLHLVILSLATTVFCIIGYLSLAPTDWDIGSDILTQSGTATTNTLSNTPFSRELPPENVEYGTGPTVPAASWVPSTIPPTRVSVHSLSEEWRQLLYDILIFNSLLSPLFEHAQYAPSAATFRALLRNNASSISDSVVLFHRLIIKTVAFLDITSLSTDDFVSRNHRKLLFIRRAIMILHQYLSSLSEDDISIDSLSISDGNYSTLIIDIFGEIRREFVSSLHFVSADHSDGHSLRKYWFLIHLSKSAGSTICGTQKHMGYRQLPATSHSNCNIAGHKTPLKNMDQGPLSCAEIEDRRRRAGNIEFLASERPITGKKVRDWPTHCDSYLYLFPLSCLLWICCDVILWVHSVE